MTSYAYDLMEVQKFHDLGIKGAGVKVAVMDSGVQQHEAYALKGGVNAFDSSKPYDANLNNSHGTMVAGVVAKESGGIAPECDLYAIRIDDGVSTKNGPQHEAQIRGMDWAIDNNMDVVICSFSGNEETDARRRAFKRAYDAGIAIFCSAGNRQSGIDLRMSQMSYPAKYPFVTTSANIKRDKERYGSSCTGFGLSFSSGGVSIESTTLDKSNAVSRNYRLGTGTSYANPAVAGMYALYKNMYPSASRERLLWLMRINAERLGDGWLYGAGLPRFPTDLFESIIIHG